MSGLPSRLVYGAHHHPIGQGHGADGERLASEQRSWGNSGHLSVAESNAQVAPEQPRRREQDVSRPIPARRMLVLFTCLAAAGPLAWPPAPGRKWFSMTVFPVGVPLQRGGDYGGRQIDGEDPAFRSAASCQRRRSRPSTSCRRIWPPGSTSPFFRRPRFSCVRGRTSSFVETRAVDRAAAMMQDRFAASQRRPGMSGCAIFRNGLSPTAAVTLGAIVVLFNACGGPARPASRRPSRPAWRLSMASAGPPGATN